MDTGVCVTDLIYILDNRDVSIRRYSYNVGLMFAQLLLLCLNSL
jgi:hypothetical protein